MALDGTDYTAADVLSAAADLIEQHGLVHVSEAKSLDDFGPERGYDITRAFDEAVYGDPGWSSDFFYELGLKQASAQYVSARRAARAVIRHEYPEAFESDEAWNKWDASMTTRSYVELLRDAIPFISEEVAA